MANVPISNLTTTWNASGTTFTGFKLNVTDTASAAGSLLADFQVNGASQFSVQKSGNVFIAPTGAISSNNGNHSFRGALFGSDGIRGLGSSPSAGLFFGVASTIEQRTGVNAQTFRLYNTYTDASNYERGFMRWNSNVLEIGAEGAGTGAIRSLAMVVNAPGYNPDGTLKITIGNVVGSYGLIQVNSNADVEFRGGKVQFSVGRQTNGGNVGSIGNDGIQWGTYCPSTVSIDFRTRVGDTAAAKLNIFGQSSLSSATANVTGGGIEIRAGNGASASSGEANGGNVFIRGGTGYGTGRNGLIIMDNLPTSNPTVAGALWNNSGVLSVSAG